MIPVACPSVSTVFCEKKKKEERKRKEKKEKKLCLLAILYIFFKTLISFLYRTVPREWKLGLYPSKAKQPVIEMFRFSFKVTTTLNLILCLCIVSIA